MTETNRARYRSLDYRILQRFPPPLVRLLAVKNRKAMTDYEIYEACGIAPLRVSSLSMEPYWDTVTIGEMRKFTCGCGLDLSDKDRLDYIECYLRKNGGKPRFDYLTKSADWKTCFLPLIVSWRRTMHDISPMLPEPVRRLLAGIPPR